MRKCTVIIYLLLIVFFSSNSCVCLTEAQKKEYGILESAVTFSSDKVIGEYGDSIPKDFTAEKFMKLVKDKIPKDYYKVLKKYRLEVKSMSAYYLILIFNPKGNSLILFDYSCTPEVDGPVLLEPKIYDLEKLELYDTCKANLSQALNHNEAPGFDGRTMLGTSFKTGKASWKR